MDRKKLAIQFYEDLIALEEYEGALPKQISQKVREIGKERFIQDYPLSTLGVISYRSFWEICFDLGIVQNHFHSEYKNFNSFEENLHKIITSLIHMKNFSKYSNEDIIRLFQKYKMCS